jgi:hypothetical protein
MVCDMGGIIVIGKIPRYYRHEATSSLRMQPTRPHHYHVGIHYGYGHGLWAMAYGSMVWLW